MVIHKMILLKNLKKNLKLKNKNHLHKPSKAQTFGMYLEKNGIH